MELRLLPLTSYLAAAAYLMAWIIRQFWRLLVKMRAWWFQHQAAGKILSLRSLGKPNNRIGILLSIAGAILGVLTAPYVVSWISGDWLLLELVALGILSEELRPTQAEMNLLAVVVLMDRVRVYSKSEGDLFEALARAFQELPEVEVKQALREALHCRRSGLPSGACLATLRGMDPHLDEFFLTLQNLNWQTGSALTQIAERLHQRSARRWDRASWFMLFKDRIWPYLCVFRMAVFGALMALSYTGIATHFTAWPGRTTVLLLGLALIAAGLLLDIVLTSKWPRRVLAATLLLLALSPSMNTINILSPRWIQIHTVTDISENLPNSRFGNGLYVSRGRNQTIFQNSYGSISSDLNAQPPTRLPVPTLSLTITKTTTYPISNPPVSSEMELEKPCCHKLYQPR